GRRRRRRGRDFRQLPGRRPAQSRRGCQPVRQPDLRLRRDRSAGHFLARYRVPAALRSLIRGNWGTSQMADTTTPVIILAHAPARRVSLVARARGGGGGERGVGGGGRGAAGRAGAARGAGEAHAGAGEEPAAEGGHEAPAVFPPFNPDYFAGQLIWLAITFGF